MTPAPVFAMVTVACLALATLRRPARRATSSRLLSQPARAHPRSVDACPPTPRGPRDHRSSRTAEIDCPPWLDQALIELGLDLDPAAAWVAVRWGGALSIALALLLIGPLGALLGGAVLAGGPSAARRVLARRRADRRDAQLPQALERLASNLRAGSALGPAFVSTARAVPAPLGTELQAAAAEVEHGSGLANALEHWRNGPASGHEVQLAAAALGLAAEAGGEVARSVDRVAATLRERRELHAEARALATQARASAAVLAIAPLAFTALVAGVEPAAVAFLLTSPVGLLCLMSGLALETLGAMWMARILRSVA